MYKSQNNETEIVIGYFNQRLGRIANPCLLSIGENDGSTLSNAYDLIKYGWKAVLLEPAKEVFAKMKALHELNPEVYCYNYGIANQTGTFPFHESGSYKNSGLDQALFSSLIESETERWKKDVSFQTTEADFKTFSDFYAESPFKEFHYISIDAEGFDWEILKQIDLVKVDCRVLCIEHNGKPELINAYRSYAEQFGLKTELSLNAENILLAKV